MSSRSANHSIEYGVRCTMADGEDTLITVKAHDGDDAMRQVVGHISLFYGPGDGAGRWLASRDPSRTITQAHEAKPLKEWG